MKTRLTPAGTLLAELPPGHPRHRAYLESQEPGLAVRLRANGSLLVEIAPEHPRFLPLLYANRDRVAGTHLLEALNKGEVERTLKEAGKTLAAAKDPGPMPGYGQIFINDWDKDGHEAEVWYVGGDGDDRGFDKVVEAKIKEAFPGCKYIHYEAEGFPPRGQGWVRVYPNYKKWQVFADEDDTDVQESYTGLKVEQVKGADGKTYQRKQWYRDGKPVEGPHELPEELRRAHAEYELHGVRSKAFKEWFGDWETDPEHSSKVLDTDGDPRVNHPLPPKIVYHSSTRQIDSFDPVSARTGDFGAHFGTKKQAQEVVDFKSKSGGPEYTYEVYLNIRNPLRIRDLGRWNWYSMTKELPNLGVQIPKDLEERRLELRNKAAEQSANANTAQSNAWGELEEWERKALRHILEASGYDGIVYLNNIEGLNKDLYDHSIKKWYATSKEEPPNEVREEWARNAGAEDSWIAFRPEQIKSVHNVGTFSQKSANIHEADVQEGKDTHTYSSTQLNLPSEIAWGIRGLSQCIEDKHLTTKGREDTPHLTAKYGLHTLDSQAVRRLVQGFGPIPIIFGPVSLFAASESGKADVVKIEVISPRLHVLNQLLSQLEHTDTHPTYQPHITLAYVKPGQGARYLWGEHALQGQQLTLTTLTFSDPQGNTTDIDLTGPKLGPVLESVLPDIDLGEPGPFVTVKPVTIAVDLDGTLAEYAPGVHDHATVQPIGAPRPGAKELMELLKAAGHTLLIWTCRGDESQVRSWLVENGIPFDEINENPRQPADTSAKLMADVYLDDRALYAGGSLTQVTARLAGRLQELDAKHKPDSLLPAAEIAVVVLEAYDPSEQRDNHGRWSAGPGNEDINEHHGLLAEQYHKAPTEHFDFAEMGKVMERVNELNNEQLVRLAQAAGIKVLPKSRKGILEKLQLLVTNRQQTFQHARQVDKLFETVESLSRSLEVKITSLPKFAGSVKYDDAVANPLPHENMSQKQQDSIVNLAVLDLTPADWQRCLQSVPLDQLHSFQPWVTRGKLLELARQESGGTSAPRKLYRQHPIALVQPGEPPTLLDGNHRAVLALLNGDTEIPCYLLTLDSKVGSLLESLDSQGGEEPTVARVALQVADFITLPEDVQGTNCSNCKYSCSVPTNGGQEEKVCQHPKLKGQPVNERNCCGYWDNQQALRTWKNVELQEGILTRTPSPPHPLFTGIDPHGHKWINGRQVKREDLEQHVASHYSIDVSNVPTTPVDEQEAASKAGSLWGKMKPATQQAWTGLLAVGKKTYHTLETPFRKGREMALAAAKARGASEEEVARLGKVLGMADLVTAWTVNFPLVTATTGNPVLGKASSWLPLASACYLVYSTGRAPAKTLKAAAQVLRGNKTIQESLEIMEATQIEGVPWQGPSGRWFVLRNNHPVLTKAPGSGGIPYEKSVKDHTIDQEKLQEADRLITSGNVPLKYENFSGFNKYQPTHPTSTHPLLGPLLTKWHNNSSLSLLQSADLIGLGHLHSRDATRPDGLGKSVARYVTYRLLMGDGERYPGSAQTAIGLIHNIWNDRSVRSQMLKLNSLVSDFRNPLPSVLHRFASGQHNLNRDLSTEFPSVSAGGWSSASKASVSRWPRDAKGGWVKPYWMDGAGRYLRDLTSSEETELGLSSVDVVTSLKEKADAGDSEATAILKTIKDPNDLHQVAQAQALYDLHFESQYYPVIGKKIEELRKGKGRKGLTLQNLQQLEGWLQAKRAEVPEVPLNNPKAIFDQVYGPDKVNQVIITINSSKATSEVPKAAGDYVRFVSKKTGQPVFMGQIQPRSDGGESGWGPLSVNQDDTHYHYKVKILDGVNAGAKVRNGRLGQLNKEEEADFRKPYDPALESLEPTGLDNTFTLMEAGTVPDNLQPSQPGYTGVKIEHVHSQHGSYTRRVYYVNGKVVNGPHEMPSGWTSPSGSKAPSGQSKPHEPTPNPDDPGPTVQSKTAPGHVIVTSSKIPNILYPDTGPTPESTNHEGVYKTDTHRHLAESPIIKMEPIGEGLNSPLCVTFADGSRGVWKPENNEVHWARESVKGKLWRREVATSQEADVLGLTFVPPTVVRVEKGQRGSMQKYMEGATTAGEHMLVDRPGLTRIDDLDDKAYPEPETLALAACFEGLKLGVDCNRGNWLVGPFTKIDNGFTSPDTHEDAETLRPLPSLEGGVGRIACQNLLLEKGVMDNLPIPKAVAGWIDHYDAIYDTLGHNGITGQERALEMERLESLATAAKEGKTIAEWWYEQGIEVINQMPTKKEWEKYQRQRKLSERQT